MNNKTDEIMINDNDDDNDNDGKDVVVSDDFILKMSE